MDKEFLKLLKKDPLFSTIKYDQIIFDALRKSSGSSASTSASGRKLIVLCGPPGCGKSTIKQSLIEKEGITDYIDIDPDVIRSILMSNGFTFSDDITMGGITNAFNKRMSDQAQKEGLNIVFDTTGQNYRAVSSLLRESKSVGYKTTFAVIWASKETCLRRVESRNASSGSRIKLPIDIAEKIYDGFEKGTAAMYLIDYPVRPNEMLLYNNNTDGGEPVLLFNKVEDNVIESTDFPGFYNMVLNADGRINKIEDKKGGKRKTVRRTYKKNKGSKSKRRRNKKTMRRFK